LYGKNTNFLSVKPKSTGRQQPETFRINNPDFYLHLINKELPKWGCRKCGECVTKYPLRWPTRNERGY